MIGIGASLVPDFRDKEESNDIEPPTFQTGVDLADKGKFGATPVHGPRIQLVGVIAHFDTHSRLVVWLVGHPVTNDCVRLCLIAPVASVPHFPLPAEA